MAKVKACSSEGTPWALIRQLNRLQSTFQRYIFGPCFHRHNWGPGEGYVQNCDLGDPSKGHFCVVEVTRVSKLDDRTEEDFDRALRRIQFIYSTLIARYTVVGQRTQLFVGITIDKPLSEERPTTLLELDPLWVEGTANAWTFFWDWFQSFLPYKNYLDTKGIYIEIDSL